MDQLNQTGTKDGPQSKPKWEIQNHKSHLILVQGCTSNPASAHQHPAQGLWHPALLWVCASGAARPINSLKEPGRPGWRGQEGAGQAHVSLWVTHQAVITLPLDFRLSKLSQGKVVWVSCVAVYLCVHGHTTDLYVSLCVCLKIRHRLILMKITNRASSQNI